MIAHTTTVVSRRVLILATFLVVGFFVVVSPVAAKVLYEQSKTGTAYSLFDATEAGIGFYVKLPQASTSLASTSPDIIRYTGTAVWLRVKRLGGVPCGHPFNILILAADWQTRVGDGGSFGAFENGPYCDFPIRGANRTDQSIGFIALCANGRCDDEHEFILDGSPDNEGFIMDGRGTIIKPGGFAFQICDEEGCTDFADVGTDNPDAVSTTTATTTVATSTASTTDPNTATSTATSTVSTSTGASSVLFLPGIMGSHLYEKGQQCGDFGEEQRRWLSVSDCEQTRLLLDENGNSLYDIYAKLEDSGVAADVAFGVVDSLYAKFIERMTDLEGSMITDFTPFPYDWRLRLDHQLLTTKNENNEVRYMPGITYTEGLLYKTIAAMASSSKSGKVTLVAHSNGGLVVKTLMQKLQSENDSLVAKIDNIILVGSPQVGTPDAIVGVLHGTEIGQGLVVSQEMARNLLNDAPFGYHLLPNQHYFDGTGVSVETPVIAFDAGTTTTGFQMQYGQGVDSFEELQRFMGSVSNRIKPNTNDLYTPEIGNDTLLQYTEDIADVLAIWVPASTTQVYQIAGTGMWTPKTLRYFSGEVCSMYRSGTIYGECAEYSPKLMHSTYFTRDGDGTVVVPSAAAMKESGNVKRYWLDLDKYAKQVSTQVHKNMMEVDDITTFVTTVAGGTQPTETAYIKNSSPTTIDEHHLVYRLHSPLDMYVTSDQGILSSTTNTISGAMYRRFGEMQYVIIPVGVTNATLHLIGYEAGSFTLVKEEWIGSTTTIVSDYRAIPTGTSTVVVLEDLVKGEQLVIDFDGNGIIDGVVNADKDVLLSLSTSSVPVVGSLNSSKKGSLSSATRLPSPLVVGQVAGASTTAHTSC